MNHEQEVVSPEELEAEALSASPAAPGEDDGGGVDLCPCCLKEVPYRNNLCPHCGAPVSGIAGLMPWEQVLAEGYIYRQAVEKPRRPVILMGMWMLFFPNLIMAAVMLDVARRGDYMGAVDFCTIAFWATISVAALYQTTRNYFRLSASL